VAAALAFSMMYHDVVPDGKLESSGFAGVTAAPYKLGRRQFREQLRAIAGARGDAPIVAPELIRPARRERIPFMLTFDDGGVSAYTDIAVELEKLGWRGHFFIPTELIGRPSFLSREQIRDLHGRGHLIGSHSHTHPVRMAVCGAAELLDEWTISTEVLSELIGEGVTTASVPGGYYARSVAKAAAVAGIEALFTSEPTARCRRVDGCLVIGRYAVQQWTSPAAAAGLASGALVPRLTQQVLWQSKKAAKTLGGGQYLKLRAAVRRRRLREPASASRGEPASEQAADALERRPPPKASR
jgi:peptidoglycan/xylan/chitin deacetylase (PgdA/CDA1 family)